MSHIRLWLEFRRLVRMTGLDSLNTLFLVFFVCLFVFLLSFFIFFSLLFSSFFFSIQLFLYFQGNYHYVIFFVLIEMSICLCIECFQMTSRRLYRCPKTMKRRPCWCPKPILWELNSFLMQTLSFVLINLHGCWPCEWKHSICNVKKLKPSNVVIRGRKQRWKRRLEHAFSIPWGVSLEIFN